MKNDQFLCWPVDAIMRHHERENKGIVDMKKTVEKFDVDQNVVWISSGAKKSGIVVAVIPAGRIPRECGFRLEGGMPRNHESYIVRGTKKSNTLRGTRQVTSMYWPRVSALKPVDTLSAQEIEWCKANPQEVRKLMAGR